jgi:hypothetical protein
MADLRKEPDLYGETDYQGPRMIEKRRNRKVRKKDLACCPPAPPPPIWSSYPEKTSYDDDDVPCEPETVIEHDIPPKGPESRPTCDIAAVDNEDSMVEKDGECEVTVRDVPKTSDWEYKALEEPSEEEAPPIYGRPWPEEEIPSKEAEPVEAYEEPVEEAKPAECMLLRMRIHRD